MGTGTNRRHGESLICFQVAEAYYDYLANTAPVPVASMRAQACVATKGCGAASLFHRQQLLSRASPLLMGSESQGTNTLPTCARLEAFFRWNDGTTDAYEMHASAHAQRVSSAAVNAARRHGPIRLSAVTLHAPDTWPFRVEGTRKSYHNSSTAVVHELQVCVHVRLRISPL